MAELITGPIYEHNHTKKLLHYLPNHCIVFLWHEDLDGVAVDGLIEAKVKAVINGKASMSGRYKQHHVRSLLQAGIPVFDCSSEVCKDKSFFGGEEALIFKDELYVVRENEDEPRWVTDLIFYDEELLVCKDRQAETNYHNQFQHFVENTLKYAEKECEWFTGGIEVPLSFQAVKEKDVFIIARNTNYEKDIKAIRHALLKKGVIIIAVDGAADGLIKQRICPDFIIGDMDSISEKAISCGATLLCHEHPNGSSPGKERLNDLGLNVETIRFIGTSEDVAITASYVTGAKHMYLVGCRIGMNEFLEKGRAGMGSTWLSRIQAGEIITDLKGIHTLIGQGNMISFKWSRGNHLKQSIIEVLENLLPDRMLTWKKKEVLRHD
ncbi:putative cytokinetic ring protein SteA [Halalkalibacter krulwichiae]|uniref:Thiamin pyrophosphokinase, catalytic domain n=1 Tax=Halalkalibacter krulwichiae TaxID=199441 RepID=A0A1X9MGY6_9BACI|nr:putative cytokinetic ring protein SteA [Halalkalibacter krulwichiae]ARK31383.1 Thiamin pyrophosphokinase, catalytic domain [Halalkalibacter krulwichiae]